MGQTDVTVDFDEVPAEFNAATYFVDRHLKENRGDKIAFIDDRGSYRYAELAEQVNRAANVLKNIGLRQEARIAMAVLDCIEFPAVFWGAIKAGVIPMCLNTLLTTEHYRYILGHGRAQVLVVSEPLLANFLPIIEELPTLETIIVVGENGQGNPLLGELMASTASTFQAVTTSRDDVAFWLNSSGSTGNPKGVKHRQASPYWGSKLYGRQILGIREDDLVFSAAKLFFAYGMGNANFFPLDVGATAILMAERPTPQSVMRILNEYNPTIFCGVPTLYAALLADKNNRPETGSDHLRICISAGEALPAEVGTGWRQRFGVDILDGVGSTEMLHIFLSNKPGDVRYGTSGNIVPGYTGKLVDGNGEPVEQGRLGELVVNGPTAADGYWNERAKSISTFVGPWTYTGDKYTQDEQGYYHYCGRSDDMFKSGGNWVSPFEVESALITHDKVLEAAVVPFEDEHGNQKPKAFVILQQEASPSGQLADELKEYVKNSIENWKYPRWIEFTSELPKTATGKIQRYKLRQ
jgi:benzoate-CoA ligase family protein